MSIISKGKQKQYIINAAVQEYASLPILDRSIKRISKKYGINYKTLKKYLDLNGIEINRNYNSCNFNYDFFHIIDTEEKAYWLGFLFADGYVGSTVNSVGLSISLNDIEHLQKYNDALAYSKGMNVFKTHQFGNNKQYVNSNGEPMYMVRTVIYNTQLKENLINKGCVPNKSLILEFPKLDIFKDQKLVRHFIRGYFDGDGTLGLYKHSATNPTIKESLIFIGTKQFLEAIQKYLGKGFLMQKKNCNPLTYKLSYSTKKAFIAADIMYKDAKIYLDRKYKIYLEMCHHKSGKNGEL